jgi:Apea-like HEPN
LSAGPVITDERILTAIDLVNGSRHDTLERSKFLAWLTVLDSLAIGRKRPEKICEWLDKKIAEAEDENLKSGLGNLKWESRKAAIKNLIERAGQALEEENEKIEERKTLVVRLYDVRSKLSHAGSNPIGHEHLSQAWDLTRWLLATVILFPGVLDGD